MHPFYHERIPNAPGIYRITCIITGKIYVGSAVNLRRRCRAHLSTLQRNGHHNPKLQAAFNKYGPGAFTFEVLELVLLPSLTMREQYWFKILKPELLSHGERWQQHQFKHFEGEGKIGRAHV